MDNVKDIRVAVVGEHDSGKSCLITRLEGMVVKRDADRRAFRLVMRQRNMSPESDLWSDVDFVLVTFSLKRGLGWLPEAHSEPPAAYHIAHAIAAEDDSRRLVCLVGTMSDIMTQDYSYPHLYRIIEISRIRRDGFHCLWVSSQTGSGMQALGNYIVSQVHPPPPSTHLLDIGALSITLLQRVGTWVLDMVATTFALPVPKDVNRETPDTLDLDDSTLEALLEGPEAQAWGRRLRASALMGVPTTYQIAPDLIVKLSRKEEYHNMAYVRQHTTIPVPQPRYPHLSFWMGMDLVKGKMLLECWEEQTIFMKFRIACTLRGYISQLRRLTRPTPGSVKGGVVDGPLFDDVKNDSFESSTQFRLWCEYVAQSGWCSIVEYSGLKPPLITGGEWPLVFTHGDLGLANIILSDDGILWVIDWADSGFYPPWLESVGMRGYHNAPRSWRWLRSFIAGSNEQYEWFWDCLMCYIHRI